jgi:hypothetical protein
VGKKLHVRQKDRRGIPDISSHQLHKDTSLFGLI